MTKIIGDYEDRRQEDPHGEQQAKRRRRAEDLAAKATEKDAKGVSKELGGGLALFQISMQNVIEIQDDSSPDYLTLQAIARGGRNAFKSTYITEASGGMGREHVDVSPSTIRKPFSASRTPHRSADCRRGRFGECCVATTR